MALILDAGAFIAYERGDREIKAAIETAVESKDSIKTSVAIVAQVWRDAATQVVLSRLLRGVEEIQLSSKRARAVGDLLRRSHSEDIADAALVEIAANGDEILTSDPDDIRRVAAHSGKRLVITEVS